MSNIEGSFETAYFKELEVQRELEKIEIAYARVVEKYKSYEECLGFVHYVKTLEKVFTEAKLRKWNGDKNKEELIKIKIEMLASESHLDKEIFQNIYDDFKKANFSVGQIKAATSDLLKKYNDEVCREFILYMEYVMINFETNDKIDDIKRGLIRAKMGVLACDGHPELKLLESIYEDFSHLLSGKKE